MNMDAEWDRLRRLYADNSDDELLALHARREDLTDLAQQALERVMKERRLTPGAAKSTGPSAGSSPADAHADDLKASETVLFTFDDSFQANQAVTLMTDAGIAHRMEDWSVTDTSLTGWGGSRYRLQLAMVVDRKDEAKGRAVLQDGMGLFPPAEGDGVVEALNPVADLTLLSMFEVSEGLVAAQALGEAGISYLWRDGRDETEELPDEKTVAIEVRAERLEEATKVVEAKVASLPEAGG